MGRYLEQAIERLKQFEGSVPWMYLDTVGKVTVGVGTMLPDARVAATLPFMTGDRPATAEEIAKEFARVSALAKAKPAAFYRATGSIRLSEQAITQRLTEVLEGFEGYLRAHIGSYDDLPDPAKLALLDMVYNLGPGKLFHEYPKLIAAVQRRDWADAAGACLRRGPGPARNDWTKNQFKQAAMHVAIQAEAAIEHSWRRWAPPVLGIAAGLLAILVATHDSNARPPRGGPQPSW